LDDSVKAAAAGSQALFITVFDPSRPMPYGALKKTVDGELSGEIYEFALTNESLMRMMPDLPWPQVMRIKARLDRDGQGGPDQPGDVVGEVTDIPAGAEDVVIKLDHLVE
jgi:hypothetical protein